MSAVDRTMSPEGTTPPLSSLSSRSTRATWRPGRDSVVDAGELTDEQEEELGATLMALHDALADLCAEHGYTLDDLNLDLGPLGPLLPPRD